MSVSKSQYHHKPEVKINLSDDVVSRIVTSQPPMQKE